LAPAADIARVAVVPSTNVRREISVGFDTIAPQRPAHAMHRAAAFVSRPQLHHDISPLMVRLGRYGGHHTKTIKWSMTRMSTSSRADFKRGVGVDRGDSAPARVQPRLLGRAARPRRAHLIRCVISLILSKRLNTHQAAY
jgi:hypothetical protein